LIGQRALPMIDVGDDAEVADKLRVGHGLQRLSLPGKSGPERITRSPAGG
jgi:hypothetical protein